MPLTIIGISLGSKMQDNTIITDLSHIAKITSEVRINQSTGIGGMGLIEAIGITTMGLIMVNPIAITFNK